MPTLLGPGYANFEDLVPPLLAAGRIEVVAAEALAGRLGEVLAAAPLRPPGAAPLPQALRGALDRTWSLLAPLLPPRG